MDETSVAYPVLLGVWGLIGAVWIIHTWRTYGRRGAAEAAPAPAMR